MTVQGDISVQKEHRPQLFARLATTVQLRLELKMDSNATLASTSQSRVELPVFRAPQANTVMTLAKMLLLETALEDITARAIRLLLLHQRPRSQSEVHVYQAISAHKDLPGKYLVNQASHARSKIWLRQTWSLVQLDTIAQVIQTPKLPPMEMEEICVQLGTTVHLRLQPLTLVSQAHTMRAQVLGLDLCRYLPLTAMLVLPSSTVRVMGLIRLSSVMMDGTAMETTYLRSQKANTAQRVTDAQEERK